MSTTTRYANQTKTGPASISSPTYVTLKLTKLGAVTPNCCATCRHWLLAMRSEQARLAGIPKNHAYCPIVDEDLEPFMNERVLMMRCEAWELDKDASDSRDLYDLLQSRTRRPRA